MSTPISFPQLKGKKAALLIVLFTLTFFSYSCKKCGDPGQPCPCPSCPVILSIMPNSGAGGDIITLTGTNFEGYNVNDGDFVSINGVKALAAGGVASDTELEVVVPEGAGSGPVLITIGPLSSDDPAVEVSPPVFTYGEVAISSIAPLEGPNGTIVTISGNYFSEIPSENLVTFNGVEALVSEASRTSLTVTVPKKAGSGLVEVTVKGKTTPGSDFTFEWTSIVSTIAGNGTDGYVDGQGTAARFYNPSGISVDGNGNLYIADTYNHRIRKITPNGLVSTLSGSGSNGTSDGPAPVATFNFPKDVESDESGNLYMVGLGHKVRTITPAGWVTTLAGSEFGYANGPTNNAQFKSPQGIALDSDGNIYVSDAVNSRIRKVTPAGWVTTLAGNGDYDYLDGTGLNAAFFEPQGLTLDQDGNIYVSGGFNHVIRKITPTNNVVSTFAGKGKTLGYQDGNGSMARFNFPADIEFGPDGALYVAEFYNHTIRKITLDGEVTTIAGTGAQGMTDGPGNTATFGFPSGITIDKEGNIYITEAGNNAVRKIILE